MDAPCLINDGDYIIVQRQNYTKLHKLKASGTFILGKDQIELCNIVGKPFYTTFRMIPKPNAKRVYTVEETDASSIKDFDVDVSGVDNRDIFDDGTSQLLTKDEIVELRDKHSSTDIVGKLVTNSTTFSSKTEYSQLKYIKKKQKKYFEYIQVHKPTVRLLCELLFRQDPAKIQGIRVDDLSQILVYANVHSDSNVLLYDSGTNGLVSAAVMNAIGANTSGKLVHMHPGNECQKAAFLAMAFTSEQTERCINVNVYSVLRHYYQSTNEKPNNIDDLINENNKRPHSPEKRGWQIANEEATQVLADKVNSLIITAKEHPKSIIAELLTFLKIGSPLVVFGLTREVLQELYIYLKSRTDVTALRLTSTMMRKYQVLPNRTHPDVTATNGGYILFGYKVDPSVTA